MDASQETLAKIRHFSQGRQKAEEEYEQHPLDAAARREYNEKLGLAVKDLQEKVQRQDDDIQKVCLFGTTRDRDHSNAEE